MTKEILINSPLSSVVEFMVGIAGGGSELLVKNLICDIQYFIKAVEYQFPSNVTWAIGKEWQNTILTSDELPENLEWAREFFIQDGTQAGHFNVYEIL